MNLKTAVARLERASQPADDVTLYFPTSPYDTEHPGMVRVTCWSDSSWEEFISQEECNRRFADSVTPGSCIRFRGPASWLGTIAWKGR